MGGDYRCGSRGGVAILARGECIVGDCMGVFDVSDLLWTAPLARGAALMGLFVDLSVIAPIALGFYYGKTAVYQ